MGIEHGGFASQSTFPAGQLDASARLSCDISKANGIPRDRQHFVGHGQLQPYNRTDPGPNWPWTDYLNRINTACGSTPAAAIVVDNNNANNNAASARFESSTSWQSTTGTAGYYGSNYAFASTSPVSDGATFWFYLPAAATRSVDAWWTAGTNRSATAPFVAYNASRDRGGPRQREPAGQRRGLPRHRHLELQRRVEQDRAVALDHRGVRGDRGCRPGAVGTAGYGLQGTGDRERPAPPPQCSPSPNGSLLGEGDRGMGRRHPAEAESTEAGTE